MSKATIQYKAVRGRNPKTEQIIQRGSVVLKEYNANSLFDYGVKAGFFPAGSKREVVVPAFQQMLATAKDLVLTTGNARIPLSNWISLYPTLNKAVLTEDGRLPAGAKLKMTCKVLKDLSVSITDFNLERIDDDGEKPRIAKVIADTAEAKSGEIVKSAGFNLIGSNLKMTEGSTATITYGEGEEATTISITPTMNGPELLKFAWPVALSDVAAGTKLAIQLRIVDAETGIVNSANAKATLVAA